ncbi:unnamed protein product [Rotaria sp. Silwood1]|nr:unnamed protein product [Rotaria sp. Silwood1]
MAFLNNTTNVTFEPLYLPQPIQFSILLVIAICSVPCFIFDLYHCLTIPSIRHALHNHVIILLLIFNGIQTVTDVPIQLSSYYTGTIWPPNVSFCIFDYFIDYYLFTNCFLLLTWASFERHILIFHTRLYDTYPKRLIGHYIPLGFCCIYPFVYYIVFLLFYPCENYYDTSIGYCAPACYLSSSDVMALYEQIVHGFALILLTFIFNVLLLIRIFRQKQRVGRQLTWTKNRKIAVQLLGVWCLFVITNGGFFLIQLGQLLWDPNFGIEASNWIYPLSMCMPPLTSFVCLGTLKDLRQKIRILYSRHRRILIVPAITKTVQMNRIVPIISRNI